MQPIRRTILHIALIAALAALAGQALAPAMAWAAYGLGAGGSGSNPAINSAVQEALSKAQAQKALGGAGGSVPGTTGLPGGAAGVPGGAGGVGSGAAGSSGSFSSLTGGTESEEEPERKLPKTAASTAMSPLSSGLVIPIVIVAGGLLAGIAFLIVRDARGVTPAGDLLADAGLAAARAARLRKRRAKAKAARKQRKRNR